MKVLVIGRGRVGRGLARSLQSAGDTEVELGGRRVTAARLSEVDLVILAVPDAAIEPVSDQIAPKVSPRASVLHCAGARGTDALRACERRGCAVGVMHPLVSFPSKRSTPSFEGTTFTLHGTPKAVKAGRAIARRCGARAVVAESGDPAYHAAAALAANGAVGLAFAAIEVLEQLGFGRRDAERAIGGILRTVADNIQDLGVPAALTGPIARGEPETIVRHRAALRRFGKPSVAAYDAVTPAVVRCARAAGLTARKARAILAQVGR